MISLIAALVFAHPGSSVTPRAPQAAKATCCSPTSMADFGNDPAFLAAHLAPLEMHFKASTGKNVDFPATSGDTAHGFYVPPTKGVRSAVIMVHEFWGLNDHIRQEAETLHAETGYAVLAVDLYDGKVTTDAATASQYMQNADPTRCIAIAGGALEGLKDGQFGFHAKKIGTVGYCFGGGWSERTAVLGSANVQACVVYYGMPDITAPSLAKLKAPVLMFAAGNDKWINSDVVHNFAAAMAKAHKSLVYKIYPNTEHAFANPSNPKFDKAAAADSKRRELAFFKSRL